MVLFGVLSRSPPTWDISTAPPHPALIVTPIGNRSVTSAIPGCPWDERPRIRFALVGEILAFLIPAVAPTWANEDYLLTGIYELTGSTDVGEEILVTIEVRIFNGGDLDAYNITDAF